MVPSGSWDPSDRESAGINPAEEVRSSILCGRFFCPFRFRRFRFVRYRRAAGRSAARGRDIFFVKTAPSAFQARGKAHLQARGRMASIQIDTLSYSSFRYEKRPEQQLRAIIDRGTTCIPGRPGAQGSVTGGPGRAYCVQPDSSEATKIRTRKGLHRPPSLWGCVFGSYSSSQLVTIWGSDAYTSSMMGEGFACCGLTSARNLLRDSRTSLSA